MLITGVDIIEIKRVEKVALLFFERFLKIIYTDGEIKYCRGRAPQLARRFAAKEAVMNALGTGIRGVGWRDVEVTRKRGMAPDIKLHGRAQKRASQIGLTGLAISLSHSKEFAVASVIGESTKGNLVPINQ